MDEKKYNGWTNYETWAVALWLGNDKGSYNYWREVTRKYARTAVADSIFTAQEAARFGLSDRLKSEIQDGSPRTEATLYTDLLNAALSEVDWEEIADSWLDDFKDEIEEEEEVEA